MHVHTPTRMFPGAWVPKVLSHWDPSYFLHHGSTSSPVDGKSPISLQTQFSFSLSHHLCLPLSSLVFSPVSLPPSPLHWC